MTISTWLSILQSMTTEWIDRVRTTSLAIGHATATAMERIAPNSLPAYAAIGTGQAVFCGPGSPLTQVSWLAYGEELKPSELDQVENFFGERTSTWEYIVTPYSSPSLLPAVVQRGWTEVQYENVMGCPVRETAIHLPPDVEVHLVQDNDRLAWAQLAMAGFFTEGVPPGFENLNDILVNTDGTLGFIATYQGIPAGAASMMLGPDAVYLGGASTLPEYRGKGLQTALLQSRLTHAHSLGLDLALCECLPGSQSQRNQERAGFQVLYTKLVLTRPEPQLPQ